MEGAGQIIIPDRSKLEIIWFIVWRGSTRDEIEAEDDDCRGGAHDMLRKTKRPSLSHSARRHVVPFPKVEIRVIASDWLTDWLGWSEAENGTNWLLRHKCVVEIKWRGNTCQFAVLFELDICSTGVCGVVLGQVLLRSVFCHKRVVFNFQLFLQHFYLYSTKIDLQY